MDGYGVAKKLKNNINTSYIPIILLTSKSEYTDRIEGLEMGVDGYLSKPFVVDELDAMILNLIENRLLLKGKFSGKQDQDENIKPIEVEANDEVLMKKIMRVINDNIDDPDLNVEKLAKEVGISRVQLHRKMKQLTGISTGDFIRNIRLKQAATLLRENKINISQVAYAVGFASHTHFSAAFKKFYGVTPSEFISKDEQTT
jgi:AraC-like DNA-binding protein